MKPDAKTPWNVGYWLLALVSLQSLWQTRSQVETVPYSVFEKALRELTAELRPAAATTSPA